MVKLGVNVDHVATVRQARRALEPDPVHAARLCEKAGCGSIVCHLREDRRHINDSDVKALRRTVKTRLNLEMSIAREIVDIACRIRPNQATLVPEKRQELTTEGGLDVAKKERGVTRAVRAMQKKGIEISLFIDPYKKQIDASKRAGVNIIELHTGEYANAKTKKARAKELARLKRASQYARRMGIVVNAGHGLDYNNVKPVARIAGMNELNIGHSIVSRAVLAGMEKAVREMLELIR
ncbi:pyridoxine 5'-phosphate synthase [Candidatus Omnitrophota bacterium]